VKPDGLREGGGGLGWALEESEGVLRQAGA
jgi:hypothetical protein